MNETAQTANLAKIYAPGLLNDVSVVEEGDGTTHCWYLGYGSNMSETSFLRRRGIRPLKTVVVHCPTLDLAFNLPGLPYVEPRFANVIRYADEKEISAAPEHPWGKGLIGVAYYVTVEEMATILRTEGGGSSYQVIQVDCHEIQPEKAQNGEAIQVNGETKKRRTIRANTLYCSDPARLRTQLGQPSPRYMNLLRTGAREKSLPEEYIKYLDAVDTYRRTSIRQTIGLTIFVLMILPFFLFGVVLGRIFQKKNGEAPKWAQKITRTVFGAGWKAHDAIFRPIFGNGEVSSN